jgi:putative ABC transport system substrate-binding protein
MLFSGRDQIAAVALARKLPTAFGYEPHVVVGGLVSYGIDLIQCSYRISNFVDKILHGTKPSDLPVEFPTKMRNPPVRAAFRAATLPAIVC